jgi:hypothetical protein
VDEFELPSRQNREYLPCPSNLETRRFAMANDIQSFEFIESFGLAAAAVFHITPLLAETWCVSDNQACNSARVASGRVVTCRRADPANTLSPASSGDSVTPAPQVTGAGAAL